MREPIDPKTAHGLPSRRRLMLSAAGLLASSPLARALQDVTFSTEVKVVNVLANVHAKNGEIVRGLTKDDFVLSEDGRPQNIRYFSSETDLPLTLGLLVDTSMSQRRVLDAERIASYDFLDQVLREATDHVFIVQFDMGVEIRQPLTSSRHKLEAALAQVDAPSMHQLQLQRGGGTLLYEAVAVAARDVMRAQTGRKALIVISDGVDTGSEIPLVHGRRRGAARRHPGLLHRVLRCQRVRHFARPAAGRRRARRQRRAHADLPGNRRALL